MVCMCDCVFVVIIAYSYFYESVSFLVSYNTRRHTRTVAVIGILSPRKRESGVESRELGAPPARLARRGVSTRPVTQPIPPAALYI